MSDFFAALAARIVQRPDERAAEAVRPRLPALFEPTGADAAGRWGESVQDLAVARPEAAGDSPGPESSSPEAARPAAPARFTSAPSLWAARIEPPALHTEQAAPRVAVAQPLPPPQTILVQSDVPTASPAREIDRPVPSHSVPTAPTLPPPPSVEAKTVVARSTTIVHSTVAPPAPAAAAVEPKVGASARVAAPQPSRKAPPAPRVARGAPPRVPAPLPAPPETTIHVAIGRVDVRAATPQPERRPALTASPVMSLEEYLENRKGGPGR
jgi:hypothetical protein